MTDSVLQGQVEVFPRTHFEGMLSHGDRNVAVSFDALIDHRGTLILTLAPLRMSPEAFALGETPAIGKPVRHLRLDGTGPAGETFSSDTFFITRHRHASTSQTSEIQYSGECARARLTRRLPKPASRPTLDWLLQQFQVFGPVSCSVDVGLFAATGAAPSKTDPDALTGRIVVQAHEDAADQAWWEKARALVEHIGRVMSLAQGAYLRPCVERRVDKVEASFLVVSRATTTVPFLPPFHFLNLQPIFECACTRSPEVISAFKVADPALRWLLAPGGYDEIRLLTAMTAIENIVDTAYPDDGSRLMAPAQFKKFAKAVREVIAAFGVPDAVAGKLPELNRASFVDKMERYIGDHDIKLQDFDADALKGVVKARNHVVHRGYYFDDAARSQPDIWHHILIARELVTRMLLAILQFEGTYFSVLHGSKPLSFPQCQPLGA